MPPIPAGVHFMAIANNVDPTLSLGVRGQGPGVSSDRVVSVAVSIDDAHPEGSTGLTEAHLALTYDPRVLSVSAADVHLGSVLAAGNGWSVVPTINPTTGQIAIALSSITPITSTIGGSLVTIDFHQIAGEPGGVSPRFPAIALVASVNLTAQEVVRTELEDAQGTFTLTPEPTNGFAPRLGSVVRLTASAAAGAAPSVGDPAPVNLPAPVEISEADSPGADPLVREPANSTSSAAVVEPSAPGFSAGPTVVADPAPGPRGATSGHAAAVVSLTSGLVSALNTAPIPSLVFQVGTLPPASMAGAWGAGSQRFVDPWFQALAKSEVSAMEPALLVGTVKDAFELAPGDQPRLSPSPGEDFDGLVYSAADRAALDRYFAQAADDADQTPEDE
jgi:hypothetical protein